MTDLPLLMSGPMVRAYMAGRKTQTRRVVTSQNSLFDGGPWPRHIKWGDLDWAKAWVDEGPSPAGNPGPYWHVPYPKGGTTHRIYSRAWIGDRFWVRETWQEADDDPYWDLGEWQAPNREKRAIYKADCEGMDIKGWKPSIFMPRWACRHFLEIVQVRAERVRDINTEDCIAEGLKSRLREYYAEIDLRAQFLTLWDEINLKRGYGWDINPPLWIYHFPTYQEANRAAS